MCDFKISDKVVCIDDSNHPKCSPTGLKRGVVYTVSGIWMSQFSEGIVVVDVVGCSNICNSGFVGPNNIPAPIGTNIGWRHIRFRKLEDIKAENATKNISANKQPV